MNTPIPSPFARVFSLFGVLLCLAGVGSGAEPVQFNRDVRPILSDKCFHCHGPDSATREAGLRLDREEAAKADREASPAIVEGHPQKSVLVQRIFSESADEQMPPSDSGRRLSTQEKEVLKRWVAEGAQWEAHWSFVPPGRPDLPTQPAGAHHDWARNSIDRFVLQRMKQQGLKPSPEASRETLIRRVTLDLTGLPPTIAEVDAFLTDASPLAYEHLVDRLLSSPRYGEHLALPWLDAARYADTDGYQNDGPRTMWRWRDWVIKALNADMPFDQFTIEQLAGDMLPDATLEQRIATGFNRNHRYNSEAGLVLDEFLLENAVDRVDTTMAVWQGLTLGCARCHDHKYDPFSQREYYQLIDMFDNASESGRAIKFGNSEPVIHAPTIAQQATWDQLNHQLSLAEARWESAFHDAVKSLTATKEGAESANNYRDLVTEQRKHQQTFDQPAKTATANKTAPSKPRKGKREGKQAGKQAGGIPLVKGNISGPVGEALRLDGNEVVALGPMGDFACHTRGSLTFFLRIDSHVDSVILSRQQRNTRRPGFTVEIRDGRLAFFIITRWVAGVGAVETAEQLPVNQWIHVAVTNDGSQFASGMKIFIDGEEAATRTLFNTNSNTGGVAAGTQLQAGGGVHGDKFRGAIDEVRSYSRTLWADEILALSCSDAIPAILDQTVDQRGKAAAQKLKFWLSQHPQRPTDKDLQQAYAEVRKARNARLKFLDSLPTTMVMNEDTPRETHIRSRGVYDQRTALVKAAAPEALTGSGSPPVTNRLEFARWLVSEQNPLTARVIANRVWQHHFGRGLVKTSADFGFQGALPTHPQLLDHLAMEFQDGWSRKQLSRMIVTSAAYRQATVATRRQRAADPVNQWYSRGPRQRLSAQALRDQALALSGLLVQRQGGPSVSPYQVPNLWREMSNMTYRQSKGADLYRRSLYTIWKRTVAPPSMAILDAADRESCVVRPKRTNTPLQALTLLNEQMFVEAARHFGQRMLLEGGDAPLVFGFRMATSRPPTATERQWLREAHQSFSKTFHDEPQRAAQLLAIGESSYDKSLAAEQLAAMAAVANILLNLDETVTRD